MAEYVSVYSNTSLLDAYSLPTSVAQRFIDGKVLAEWRKSKESEFRATAAVIDRLNSIIKSIGYLAKAIRK